MIQTWRWFGPKDKVSLRDVAQAGASGIVSALHHIPPGQVWSPSEIRKRHDEIETDASGTPTGLTWQVVESLPVSEDIKKQTGDWRDHIAAYKTSLENVAASGLQVICYNFMPVLDWTRTDLAWPRPDGALCMRFDIVDFLAFDAFILCRPGAIEEMPEEHTDQVRERFATMTETRMQELADSIVCGLPGSAEAHSLDDVRQHLAEYDNISPGRLRANLVAFLEEVVPVAERLGLRMCCHPDDPPFDLLGLPRITSTEADYVTLTDAVPSPANGITLCTGSLGARPDNDLPGMMRRLGPKVHFLHLRNVSRDAHALRGSFFEARHLEGNTDMVAVIAAVLEEEARRKAEGRADWHIPMRPDHGQDILDDLNRRGQPGYPAIGRLKGLAELRGIETALLHPVHGLRG